MTSSDAIWPKSSGPSIPQRKPISLMILKPQLNSARGPSQKRHFLNSTTSNWISKFSSMEAPPDGNGNPEETPKPSLKKTPKKKKNSQSETSSEEDTSLNASQEIQGQPSETLPPVSLEEARDSRTRSIGTTGSVHVSTAESQTSPGYTNESTFPSTFSYEPLTHSSSSSFGSIETLHGPPPTNFLREIHVAINPSAPEDEIQSVRFDLQELLTNAIFHIGRRNNQAIYIITYNYM